MNTRQTPQIIGAYIRVSTDKQDADNQWHGVVEYANKMGYANVQKIEDTASGKTSWRDRSIGKMIDSFSAGDIIIVSEISRLARTTLNVLEVLKEAATKDIEIHVVKQNLVFKGEGDMTSTILATVLAMVAQIEREFISQRTKEALAKKKASGVQLGRPRGKAAKVKLDEKREEIIGMLNAGASKTSIARIVGCSTPTLYAWIKREEKRIKKTRKTELKPSDLEFLGQKQLDMQS